MNADEATRELILRLAMEDAEERREHLIGKARVGSILTDEQIALGEHALELERALQVLIDAHFAHSMDRAIETDGDLLRTFEDTEAMERQDRGMALNLSRTGSLRTSAAGTPLRTPAGARTPLREVAKPSG
jgi:hypothetical protein